MVYWIEETDGRSTPTARTHIRIVERVIDVMLSDLEKGYTLKELAKIAGLSPFHFIRIFKEATGVPPLQFLYACRLQLAKRLLLTTGEPVTDICYRTGYNSHGTFTTRFTQLVGVPPSALRKAAQDVKDVPVELLRAFVERFKPPVAGRAIRGRVAMRDFDGFIAVALFDSAIPQGTPISCTLLANSRTFALPLPPEGQAFHLLTVALPWAQSAKAFLLQEPIAVGWHGPLTAGDLGSDSVIIALREPRRTDPPLLYPLTFRLLSEFEKVRALPLAFRAGTSALAVP